LFSDASSNVLKVIPDSVGPWMEAINLVEIFERKVGSLIKDYGDDQLKFVATSDANDLTVDLNSILELLKTKIKNRNDSNGLSFLLNLLERDIQKFYEELGVLEIHTLLAAFTDLDGKLIMDMFKAYCPNEDKDVIRPLSKLATVLTNCPFLGFYYKVLIIILQ
jgi:hypothetical protein